MQRLFTNRLAVGEGVDMAKISHYDFIHVISAFILKAEMTSSLISIY